MKALSNFILESSIQKIDEEDIKKLQEWFEENIKYFGVETSKGTYAVYFPDRETLKNKTKTNWQGAELPERMGLNNIPHLTISKPSRLKGGFGITVYKKGRWAASDFPDPRRAFDKDGNPKYATVEHVISMLNKNIINGKWKEDLDIQLK
jgi:hypothetical protein